MSKKDKGKKGVWDTEDVIQAVVIADSFNFRFLPITIEKPRCLLPLVNRPLIDYTIEFLAVSGVQEIFVLCCTHAELIKAHLEASRWNLSTSPVKLRTLVSEDCQSVGDALRSIDSLSLIKSDFVLVSGDLVANMELKEVIDLHKEVRKTDRMAVMTCVYKKASPRHRTRSREDDIIICTNPSNRKLLFCEKVARHKKITVPMALFDEHPDIDLHYDLLDCHVSICSPDVPQLFSDNFDYQTQYHFIRGLLVNEEIMGHHIYTHFISDQYAARVSNLHTYDAISQDVIHRWVYPLVPDNSSQPIGETYSYGRHNIYLNANVSLGKGSALHEDVVVGPETVVGMDTQITRSSIGRKCKIGERVTIEGSFIWDGVTIESDSVVRQSIVCDGAHIKANVTVHPGCILSYGVVVGPNFAIPEGTRLTTKVFESSSRTEWEEGEDEYESDKEESKAANSSPHSPKKTTDTVKEDVGPEGKGFSWHPPKQDAEDELEDEQEDIAADKWPFTLESSASSSESSSLSSESPEPVGGPAYGGDDLDTMLFYNEILDSVRSGLAGLVPNENTILMINASKHAYNIPIQDVPGMVVKAILEGPQNATPTQTADLLHHTKNAIRHYNTLLRHYIKDVDAQRAVMDSMAECALKQPLVLPVFPKVVLLLYNADIVEEDTILEWHKDFCKSEQSAKKGEVMAAIKPVIEWLQNAEEESSDEGDED